MSLLWISVALRAEDADCEFPEFLQNKNGEHWFTSGQAVAFSGKNMTSANVTWGLIDTQTTQTTCFETLNETTHTYVVIYSRCVIM